MEKIKKIIFDNKNIINIGLIGSLVLLISKLIFDYINAELTLFTIILPIPLFMYFLAIKLRLKGKNINIKILQNILFVCYIFFFINSLLSFILYGETEYIITNIMQLCYHIIIITYMFNVFYKKGFVIDNKLYIIVSAIYVIIGLFCIIIPYYYYFIESLVELLVVIGNVSVSLYFYNYYNLLKGAKSNG